MSTWLLPKEFLFVYFRGGKNKNIQKISRLLWNFLGINPFLKLRKCYSLQWTQPSSYIPVRHNVSWCSCWQPQLWSPLNFKISNFHVIMAQTFKLNRKSRSGASNSQYEYFWGIVCNFTLYKKALCKVLISVSYICSFFHLNHSRWNASWCTQHFAMFSQWRLFQG